MPADLDNTPFSRADVWMIPHRTALQDRQEAQRKHASARARQSRVDASVEGAARIKLSVEYAAQCRRAWQALESIRKTMKLTGALKLAIVGSRSFCEPTANKSRDDMMAERRALGAALDLIAPTVVIASNEPGAARWSLIWAERRGVTIASDGAPDAAVAFELDTWSADRLGRLEKASVPVYEVAVR